MKKKIFLISIIIIGIFAIILGIGIVNFIKQRDDKIPLIQDSKVIEDEENHNTTDIEQFVEDKDTKDTVEPELNTQENIELENDIDLSTPIQQESNTQENQTATSKKNTSSGTATTSTKNSNQTASTVNQQFSNNAQNSNSNNNNSSETTNKKEEPVWCDEGGTKHWQGTGANEHGYYKTWDEAWNACQNFMKGMTSGNYAVRQCSCGLYYFWVVEN